MKETKNKRKEFKARNGLELKLDTPASIRVGEVARRYGDTKYQDAEMKTVAIIDNDLALIHMLTGEVVSGTLAQKTVRDLFRVELRRQLELKFPALKKKELDEMFDEKHDFKKVKA